MPVAAIAIGLAVVVIIVAVVLLTRKNSCPCPQGWSRVGKSQCGGKTPCCQAPAGYAGSCAALSGGFGAMTVAEKQAWATKCGAKWSASCLAEGKACMCPSGWTRTDASECGGKDPCCKAPASYGGDCGSPSHFKGYGPENKALWAKKCGADWTPDCKQSWTG